MDGCLLSVFDYNICLRQYNLKRVKEDTGIRNKQILLIYMWYIITLYLENSKIGYHRYWEYSKKIYIYLDQECCRKLVKKKINPIS